jgi:hypothetical protein
MTGFLSGWFTAPTEDPYAKISSYGTGAVLLNLYQSVRLPPHKLQKGGEGEEGASASLRGYQEEDDSDDASDDDKEEYKEGDEEAEDEAQEEGMKKKKKSVVVTVAGDEDEDEAVATANGEKEAPSAEGPPTEPAGTAEASGGEASDNTGKGKEEVKEAEEKNEDDRVDGAETAGNEEEEEGKQQGTAPAEMEKAKENERDREREESKQEGESRPAQPAEANLLLLAPQQPTTPERPPDVLVNFLSFAAYLLPDMRDARQKEYGRLCLRTLLLLTEDRNLNQMLHDPALAAPVPVYRKTKTTRSVVHKTQPLACSLIDVMVCVMRGNLKRQLPSDIFCPCLNIIRYTALSPSPPPNHSLACLHWQGKG